MKVSAKAIATSVLALAMGTSAAWADTAAPLAAGKPAGVKAAQNESDNTLLWVGAAAIVAGGIALAVSGNDDNGITTPQTSTNPPTTTTTTS